MRTVFVIETPDLKALHTPPYLTDTSLALLDQAADGAGLEDVEIVFAVEDPRLAGKGKSKIGMTAIRAERPRVLSEIADHAPELVICFGPVATASVFDKGNLPENELFRQAHEPIPLSDEDPGPKVYVTVGLGATRWKEGLKQWVMWDVEAAVKGWSATQWGDYTVLMPGTPEWDIPPQQLSVMWSGIRQKISTIGYDLETFRGVDPWAPDARIRMAVISDQVGRAWVVQATPDSRFPLWVYDLIEDPTIVKAGSNIKFDYLWHRRFGHEIVNMWDTSTHEHVLDESNPRKDLKSLTFIYCPKLGDYSRDQRQLEISRRPRVNGKAGKKGTGWPFIEDHEMYQYAGGDGEASIAAALGQAQKINALGLDRPARLFRDLYTVLADMEHNGACVDLDVTRELDVLYRAKLDTLRAELVSVLGPINPNSPKPLAAALKRAVPEIKLTLREWQRVVGNDDDTETTTQRVVLEREAHKHPIIQKVLEFRSYRVRHSTFIKGVLEKYAKVHSGGVYVHPSFNTDRVETFRLSSSRPNGQNYPKDDEDPVLSIKRQFVSRFDSGRILDADESQIEIRAAAWLSGDPKMLEAINLGEDIHTSMAAVMLNKAAADVTVRERDECKHRTFLILYGGGPKKLAQDLRIHVRDATRLINEYYTTFSGLRKYIDQCHADVRKTLEVETPFGFKRRFVEPEHWDSPDGWRIQRQAFNTMVQNTAACLVYCAMIWLHAEMRKLHCKSKLILQVHDSIVVDTHPQEGSIVSTLLRQALETEAVRVAREDYGVDFTVPLKCDIKQGPSWGEQEKT